jgi:hypothetical protein
MKEPGKNNRWQGKSEPNTHQPKPSTGYYDSVEDEPSSSTEFISSHTLVTYQSVIVGPTVKSTGQKIGAY